MYSWNAIKVATVVGASKGLSYLNKNIGRKYLIHSLGQMPGLPSKASQFLATRYGVDVSPHQPHPLSLQVVKEIIERESPQLSQRIATIDPHPKTASLGQVHRVLLEGGQELAIKIQYPEVEAEVIDQLQTLLEGLKRHGPELDIAEYSTYLSKSMEQETNYLIEGAEQTKFEVLWDESRLVKIPHCYLEWSKPTVLVQEYVESEGLEILKKRSASDRLRIAENLVEVFLRSLMGVRALHTDLQPNNWGVSGQQVVLYDFGSTLTVAPQAARAIYSLVEDPSKAWDSFHQLGFDSDKLKVLAPFLEEVAYVMFEPFRTKMPFDPNVWDFSKRISSLLGGDKWTFRTAGPPWFLLVMRSAEQVLSSIRQLNVKPRVHLLWKKVVEDYPSLHEGVDRCDAPLPKVILAQNKSKLNVRVSEKGEEVVSLELPGRAVDRIEDVIPQPVLEKIQRSGIQLEEIKKRVLETDYISQELFQSTIEGRNYRVWLS